MKIQHYTLSKVIIAGLLSFCVACSGNSNQPDLKLIPVKSGEKWGYINSKGEYVINPQFQDADFFRDGLAKVVYSDGKTGYINEDGKYAIPAKYKSGTYFADGLAFVVPEGSFPVCIDKSGETKFPLKQAKSVYSFSGGLAVFVTDKGEYGFVDKTGKIVITPQFNDANSFSEGLAAIKQNESWGFIDKTGKIVINPQFEAIGNFKNGKAVFRQGRQWGYIDTKGNYAINPEFDGAGDFSEGMAVITQGKEYGYITEKGNIWINPQFDGADNFQNGMAVIRQGYKYGYINKEGKIEINPQFENAFPFLGDFAFVQSANKWGIIDKTGKYRVNPQYNHIKTDTDNVSSVRSDYYDVTDFIDKFFKKAGNKTTFDGFTAESTLRNIANNPLYEEVNANNQHTAYTRQKQEITNEIFVNGTQFHFANPIYENTWGGRSYDFSEKVSAIEYPFALSGDAYNKGGVVANALRTEIETQHNLKMETAGGQYTAYQDNGLSFAVLYGDSSVSLYVGFNKDYLKSLIISKTEQYADHGY